MVHANVNGDYFVTDDYVSMGAPILKADSFKDIFDEWGKQALDDPNRVMKGWRFIDAERTSKGHTRVTSVWADEKFDFNKFRNPNGAQLGMNPNVPACPGCRLVMRSRSASDDEPMALEQYVSQQDPDSVVEYYKSTMASRGWELSDTTSTMDFVAERVPDHPFNTDGRFLTFARGNAHVTYSIVPGDTGTMVMASESW